MGLTILILIGVLQVVLLAVMLRRVAQPPTVTVEAPSPVVVPAPKVEVVASPRLRTGTAMEIKLMSGSLRRELGCLQLAEHQRTPTVSARASDGTWSQFVASHQEPGGQWVYRRVGVERER